MVCGMLQLKDLALRDSSFRGRELLQFRESYHRQQGADILISDVNERVPCTNLSYTHLMRSLRLARRRLNSVESKGTI